MTALYGVFGGIIVALIALAGTWLTERAGRRTTQQRSDSRDRAAVMDAWRELLEPYRQEVARLNVRVTELSTAVEQLQSWRERAVVYIRLLVQKLRENGIEPPDPPSGVNLD